MANFQQTILIGISGGTNSGKSTLTKKLLKIFPGSSSICQDTYFYDPERDIAKLEPVPELTGCFNWEKLSSLDMERMLHDIESWVQENKASGDKVPPVLFVDGFTVYNYRPITSLLHQKFFITIKEDVCRQRRSTRHYEPADTPGYFDQIVWPMYLSNLNDISDQTDIVYYDSNRDQEEVLQWIVRDIKERFPQLATGSSSLTDR